MYFIEPDAYNGYPDSMGFSLKLVYQMDSALKSPNFFTTLLLVPSKENFAGLRTQFSCPLDAFLFINREYHEVEGISINSSCLGINLGSFPIVGLETHLYVFERCNRANPLCEIFGKRGEHTFFIWSAFPQHIQSVNLGNFIKALPVSDSNQTALYAKFSPDTRHAMQATILNTKLSLFEVDSNFTAAVDDEQLQFETVIKLFGRYPARVMGSVKQTNNWQNAVIEIYGSFLSNGNNIPDLICQKIKTYVHLIYNRSSFRVKNAETAYTKALQQSLAANATYREREAKKNASAILIQKTKAELLEIKNKVMSETQKLEMEGDLVFEVLKGIDDLLNKYRLNLCTDEDLCMQQDPSLPHLYNVSTPVQGNCTDSCPRTTVISDIVGVKTDLVWGYKPKKQCKDSPKCRVMDCAIESECTEGYVSVPTASEIPTMGTTTEKDYENCNKPCPEGHVDEMLLVPHAGNVGCKINTSAAECLIGCTHQCLFERDSLYEQLKNLNHRQAAVFERLEKARDNETVTKLRLMRYRVQHKLNEDQFNVSKEAVKDKSNVLKIVSMLYSEIKQQNPLHQLENITNVTVCGPSPLAYLTIKSVDFSTAVSTESPTILDTDITVSIPSLKKISAEKAYIDFHNINSSLQEVAVAITKSILDQNFLNSRRYRSIYNTNSKSETHLQFQKSCTDIKNILLYVKELNESISSLATIAISSMLELHDNMNEMKATINRISVSNASATNRSISTDELMKLMEAYVMNNQYVANVLQFDLFQSWQAKMEYLHNQTKSAAGLSCLGFSDCLQEVVDTLDDLVNASPLQDFKEELSFSSAQQDLLDLALLQNYSIILAVARTQKIYKIASNPDLFKYWCTSPPNITIQPLQRVKARENTTVVLLCKAEVKEFVTYQWKKNSVQMLNQRNGTLVLKDIKLGDSGNYTCVVTNQVASVTSINASVEVQEFPSFSLQPENVDVYFGSMNGAIIKGNATGFPNPGYRWYFQPKGSAKFSLMLGKNQNELVIQTPLPENEGSYYCEAFNEQGTVKSRIVNLTVLESTVVQAARTIYLHLTKIYNDVNFTSLEDGSGNEELEQNISLSSTTIEALKRKIINTLHGLISFDSTSLENVTITPISATTVMVGFTLYSENISYPENSLSHITQMAPKARLEWVPVWEKLQEVLTISELFIGYEEEEYKSDPKSLKFDMLQFACPPGKELSSVNNLLCGT